MDLANEVGADAVSHGCTGKGNDQACLVIISLTSIQHANYVILTCSICKLFRFGSSSHFSL